MFIMHMKRTQRLRRLTVVPRWVIMDTIRNQNVAEHSYNVAVITAWLFEHNERIYNNCQRDMLLMYALLHDEMEAITGDIASPSKQSMAFSGSLESSYRPTDRVKKVVKLADMCDAFLFVEEELNKGNVMGELYTDVRIKLEQAWGDILEGDIDHFISSLLQSFSMQANPALEYTEEGYR